MLLSQMQQAVRSQYPTLLDKMDWGRYLAYKGHYLAPWSADPLHNPQTPKAETPHELMQWRDPKAAMLSPRVPLQ